jgi:hypothetical protein
MKETTQTRNIAGEEIVDRFKAFLYLANINVKEGSPEYFRIRLCFMSGVTHLMVLLTTPRPTHFHLARWMDELRDFMGAEIEASEARTLAMREKSQGGQ